MRLLIAIFLISLALFFSSCGGPQPSGDVDICEGALGISEVDTTVTTNTFSAGQKVGQHFQLRTNLILNSVMLKTEISGLTSMTISIYKMGVDEFPEFNTPMKVYTITSGLTTAGKQELWIQLPETLDLPSNLSGSSEDFYFIAFEGAGGTFTADVGTLAAASSFRLAYRDLTSTYWDVSERDKGLSLGLRGSSDCHAFQGL